MNKGYGLCVAALLLFFCAAVVYSQPSELSTGSNGPVVHGVLPNKELSIQYTRLARQSAEVENFELSTAFVETALVFWEHNPDALYLTAEIHLHNEEYDKALEIMGKALGSGTFRYYQKNEVLLTYVELLVRFDRSREALVLIQGLPAAVQNQSAYLQSLCRALIAEGREDQLVKTLRKGSELYPSDSFFQQHMMKVDSEYRRKALSDILRGGESNFYSKEAFHTLIPATNRPSDLAKLLVLYNEKWGDDQFSRIQGYRLKESISLKELEQLFSNNNKMNEDQLHMLMEIANVLDSTSNVKDAFRGFNGTIERDSDNDGFMEVRETYSQGVIQRVAENSDGDPEAERILEFEDGNPRHYILQLPEGNTLKVFYKNYPEVSRAENTTVNSVIEMKLIPYSVRSPLSGWESYTPPSPVPLPAAETIPALGTLLAKSARIEADTMSASEKPENYTFLRDKGLLTEMEERKTKVTADMMSGAVNERRRDSDGDGFYEIREYYREGEIVRITYDGNKNGIPEYIEEYEDKPLRMWDTDEDGIIEYQLQFEQKE